MRRSEIEPADIQLIHKDMQNFSNCCCFLLRWFPTVFSFKKGLHLNLKKPQTLLFAYSSSQINRKHTKNCKIEVWNMLGIFYYFKES